MRQTQAPVRTMSTHNILRNNSIHPYALLRSHTASRGNEWLSVLRLSQIYYAKGLRSNRRGFGWCLSIRRPTGEIGLHPAWPRSVERPRRLLVLVPLVIRRRRQHGGTPTAA